MVIQHKTSRPVQFEITKLTATSIVAHVQHSGLSKDDILLKCLDNVVQVWR